MAAIQLRCTRLRPDHKISGTHSSINFFFQVHQLAFKVGVAAHESFSGDGAIFRSGALVHDASLLRVRQFAIANRFDDVWVALRIPGKSQRPSEFAKTRAWGGQLVMATHPATLMPK